MFKPATRTKTKARVLLAGPSGSGKTRAALEIASGLGERIAVIDTENRSASLYVGLNGIVFDVAELSPPYTYEKYLAAMREAFSARYDVLVIDSLTHVWAGEGGALEQVDASRGRNENAFTAWKDVTPAHNKLLSALTSSPVHLIGTVRSKTSYVLEERQNRQGKTVQVPRKIGLAPVMRDGIEYEFSVMAEIDLDHAVTITKTRITELDSARYAPDQLDEIGRVMRTFHETGELPKPQPAPAATSRQRELRDAVSGKPAASSRKQEPAKEPTFSEGFAKERADAKGVKLAEAEPAMLFEYVLYLEQKLADDEENRRNGQPTLPKPHRASLDVCREQAGKALRDRIVGMAERGDVTSTTAIVTHILNHQAAPEDAQDAATSAERALAAYLEAEAAEAALGGETEPQQQELST